MIHAKEQRFDVSGAHVCVRIRNRDRYQVVGDFGGVLVEVRVESDEIDTTLTMLVNPRFSAPVVGQWDDVVLDGNHWCLANETPLWD